MLSMHTPILHVAMFPWFAMGHITPFMHLSNKLAERGHRVSFLIPTGTQNNVNNLNLHPQLIQFIPLSIPHVDGLPVGTETMSDLPIFKAHLLAQAFDLTQDQVKAHLHCLKPDVVFFNFSHWLPSLVKPLGSKCIYFSVISAVSSSIIFIPARMTEIGQPLSPLELMEPPPGFPCAAVTKLRPFEALNCVRFSNGSDGQISFFHRMCISKRESKALCFRAYTELEGPYCDYLQNQLQKQVLLLGPSLPDPSYATLEQKWEKWLNSFTKGSVVYCAFGSECILEKNEFQELVLGLELTGLPFLVRLKPPFGVETMAEALPEGFEERVKGRGVVHGEWLQQQQILSHPSVGCFISHCGFGSMWESLVSSCQIVLVPHLGDQFINTNFMTKVLKVAVDVERREADGWFTKEAVCKAVKMVMDEGSEVGEEVKANHQRWKDFLLTEGLQSSYMDNFIVKLQETL